MSDFEGHGTGDAIPALTDAEVWRVPQIETTLRRLQHNEFSLLYRHGNDYPKIPNSTICYACWRR